MSSESAGRRNCRTADDDMREWVAGIEKEFLKLMNLLEEENAELTADDDMSGWVLAAIATEFLNLNLNGGRVTIWRKTE